MSDDNYGAGEEEFRDTAPWYIWLAYSVTAGITFWLQAAVTEDRFVPALNVIATWLEVPDDVAGATLMAGGASTPELFGSYIALFVTHSALGVGTIVGSGIFNQLVITAGAVLAARGDELQLDSTIIIREAGFYGLSIAFLLYALSHKEEVDDDGADHSYLIITPREGALLVSGYVTYVIVCFNFEKILGYFDQSSKVSVEPPTSHVAEKEYSKLAELTKIDAPELPFLRHVKHEPRRNFHENLSTTGSSHVCSTQEGKDFCTYELESSKPSDVKGLEEVERNEETGTTSCFLWQQSFFYNKARIDVNAWQLRFFSFSPEGISSLSDRSGGRQHTFKYPSIVKIEADEKHLLVRLHRKKTHKRPYIMMAPNLVVFEEVLFACDRMLKAAPTPILEEDGTEKNVLDDTQEDTEEVLIPEKLAHEGDDEVHHSMIAYPHDGEKWEKFLFYFLFPFNLAMHFTIPDVRVGQEIGKLPLTRSFTAIGMCIVWLIGSSYVLVESLEELGRLMNIPHAIIGITISAAGTSVANFVASQCAAKQGLGNMAVSNAFGSNSFIIFMGLGLPWLTYTIAQPEGEPYYRLKDEGLTSSVIMMAVVLVAFMILMKYNNWVLHRKQAYVFVAGYILYVVIAIGQSFF